MPGNRKGRSEYRLKMAGLLKILDRWVGSGIALVLPPPPTPPVSTSISSILFIRPGGIGDAALLAPSIRQVMAYFPGVVIDILAERRNADAFELCPGIRSIIRYDVPAEFQTVLRSRYDVVIDTEQWHHLSAMVARIVRAKTKIGFATNNRRRLFTHPISYHQDTYETDCFQQLLTPLGCGVVGEEDLPFLIVPERNDNAVDRLLIALGGKPFVALFSGASIAERRWDAVKFAELANRLLTRMAVVVVGGAVDLEAARLIEHSGGVNLVGKTTLSETAAILARSSLLVSGDSGILHIAVGLGIPTVSLFGPGREKKWAPRGAGHIVINKNLSCSPCTTFGYTPKCPINARCMAEISVDEVEAAALTLLAIKKIRTNKQKP